MPQIIRPKRKPGIKSKKTAKEFSPKERKKDLDKHKAYLKLNEKKLSPQVKAQAKAIIKRQEAADMAASIARKKTKTAKKKRKTK